MKLFIQKLSLVPTFFPEAHFISLLVTLKSLHSSLILHWQPFVFNQRKMLKQCSIELSIHDTVYLRPCHRGLGRGGKGKYDTQHPIFHDFPQNWIRINYDDRPETNADAISSTVSPAHSTLSDCIKTPNLILCHSWLKTKGHCSNKFLNSFHGDWILYFLPCCFGITKGSLLVFADGHLSINLPEWKTLRSKNLCIVWVSGGHQGGHFSPLALKRHCIQVALKSTTPATVPLMYLLQN